MPAVPENLICELKRVVKANCCTGAGKPNPETRLTKDASRFSDPVDLLMLNLPRGVVIEATFANLIE